MRLSPPITIIVLIGLALGGLAVRNNVSECRFSPEGKLRWGAISEWFYRVDLDASTIPCDPWTGIIPRKPIGIIEIREDTASIRIDPSGNIGIVLHPWRDSLGYFDSLQRPSYQPTDTLRSDQRVILIGQSSPELYRRVRELVAPMRDFADYVPKGRSVPDFIAEPWLPDEDRTFLRDEFYDLDDSRTRLGQCIHPICDGGAGWQIAFWDEATGQFQSQSMYFSIGCADIAAHAGMQRVEKATDVIVGAVGATQALQSYREANQRFRP